MPTYKQLRDRIANEMMRNDLNSGANSPIALAVQDSIRHFQDESFYLNKTVSKEIYAWKWVADSVSTVAGGTTQTEARDGGDKGDPNYAAFLSIDEQADPPASGSGSSVTYAKLTPSLPTDFSQLITLTLARDNTRYELTQVSYEEIESMDAIYATGANTTTNADGTTSVIEPHLSAPAYWSYMPMNGSPKTEKEDNKNETTLKSSKGAIRIYPRPDKKYNLILSYQSTLAAPVNDTDVVFWTDDAYRMIKSYAKAVLYADYLQQFELAQANEQMAKSEYNRLVSASEGRAFPSTVVGHIL
jgi:hypothetical protein